jgi:4-hydroxybenzoate polyprenyltransferase/phosphoglycolate phosphatase-like HAD superfamily hydrolase
VSALQEIEIGSVVPKSHVLVVDLDGSLLRSDMLYESFWSAVSRDWRVAFGSALRLPSGRAKLRRYLADASDVDVTLLPYNTEVIDYLARWRQQGGRTALVTATDQSIADRVAAHLDLFDTVHGSDGQADLKGQNKADFLVDRFNRKGFAYIGNSDADLAVWQQAQAAITVNASSSVRATAEQSGTHVEHLSAAEKSVSSYVKAIRVHQWMKNVLVFIPVLAAHQFSGATLLQAFLAFLSFSLVASSVYVVNDLLDLPADRNHPRKCKRPFAAGQIPISHGGGMAVALFAMGTLVAANLGLQFLLVMAIYYALTTAYSLSLKRRAMIDICTLAGLYTIRIVAGAAATGIEPSVWLLAFSIFFFFSLAAVKRQAELIDNQKRKKHIASGRGYYVDDLPVISMMAIASGYISVMIMALYVNSPAVREMYSQPSALWGVCCILLYWLSRTVMLTHRGYMDDDPVVYAIKDRISQICGALILVFGLGGVVL